MGSKYNSVTISKHSPSIDYSVINVWNLVSITFTH